MRNTLGPSPYIPARLAGRRDLLSWAALNARLLAAAASLAAAVMVALLAPRARAPRPRPPERPTPSISRDARRPLPVRTFGGQEMFALDDLARLFDLTVREDVAAGGLTITTRAQTIVLSAGPAAGLGRRPPHLPPGRPARDGRAWFVPVDFVSRALAPALGTRVDLRKPSRLIIAGDVRMPLIVGPRREAWRARPAHARRCPVTPHTVAQEGSRDSSSASRRTRSTRPCLPRTAPDLIQAVRAGETPASHRRSISGPRFASFRSSDAAGERGAGRIVVDVVAPDRPSRAAGVRGATAADPASCRRSSTWRPPAGCARSSSTPAMAATRPARAAGGTLEKNVTLSVARRLKAALESRLGVRVILTRDGDQSVGLDERAALANNNKADLFISLHANASVRAGADRRRGLLPEPGRVRRGGAARRARRKRVAAGVRRRHARHRGHPLGDGAGAAHRAVGGARPGRRGGAARARADEPAGDPAGAVPRPRRRQHAGGARRDGLPHEPAAGAALATDAFQQRSSRRSSTASARFRDSAPAADRQRAEPPPGAPARSPLMNAAARGACSRHRRGWRSRGGWVLFVGCRAGTAPTAADARRRAGGARPAAPSARSPPRSSTSPRTARRWSACSARCRSASRSPSRPAASSRRSSRRRRAPLAPRSRRDDAARPVS